MASSRQPVYDTLGAAYTTTRRQDPRIAARIRAALGDADSVVNIGAARAPTSRRTSRGSPSSRR